MTNNTMKLATVAAFAAMSAFATNTDALLAQRDSRDKVVTPGRWHADLAKARAYAEANGLPLMAVWSNGDFCAHCLAWEGAAASDAFASWMSTSGIVFYFGAVNDGSYNYNGGTGPSPDGQEGYHGTSFYWCRNYNVGASYNFPYVRIYWPKGGVDAIYSGGTIDGESAAINGFPCSVTDLSYNYSPERYRAQFIYPGDYKTYNPSGRYMINFLTNGVTGVLRNYTPNTYAGGEFGFTYYPPYLDACIQVEYGTDLTELPVPLTRNDESARTKSAVNYLRTVYPNGHAETNVIIWAEGEAKTSAMVKLDKAWLAGASNRVTLELYSDKVELKETSYAVCVDKVPNSPSNPLFVGERTKDSLNWGEWTMDLSVAAQKVADAGGSENNAYLLVLCGGELWCPDCANTDKYLFDRAEFKNWATNTHKVALVVIDIPNADVAKGPDGTSACLLTSSIGTVSDYYLAAKGMDASGTYQCGVNYQSRHGVTLAQADEIYARNKTYASVYLNKLIPTNPYRPGVPTIYALRPNDLSIAGRIAEFASTSPKSWNANYLTRLNELIALVGDEDEELKNGKCGSGNPVISGSNKRGVQGTLSLADEVDVYRLSAQKDSDLMLTVTGPENAKVTVAVLNGTDDAVVAIATNSISSGVELSCTLPSGNCHVRIATADGDYFKAAKDGSAVAHYTLKTDSVISPGEVYDETEPIDCSGGCGDLGDAATNVWIKLVSGGQYKFKGLAAGNAQNDAVLDYDGSTEIYTSKVSGQRCLVLAPDGGNKIVFGYQKWVPGAIEFYPKAQTMRERGDSAEYDTICKVAFRRTGGLSGTAGVKISLVPEKSTRPLDAYEWLDEEREFYWGEDDDSVQSATVRIKADTHADGPTKLVFKLTKLDDYDAAVTEEEMVLTIVDDDVSNPGRAALVKADGLDIPASRRVVAKGGTKGYLLGLARVDGSDQRLAVRVVMDGTNDVGEAEWAPREGTEREIAVKFDLPEYVEGGDNKVVVSLVGEAGAKIVPEKKYLTIELIPDNATMFSGDALVNVSDLTRYVGDSDTTVEIDSTTTKGGEIEVKKISGSVPPGMTWSGLIAGGLCDPPTPGLSISGTPTAGGTYTAVFQVVEDGVAGGTVQVTMTVDDPVTSADGETEAKNPYLAVTRTVSDIMVVDIEKERLVGLLTVTVPRTGRLSGKYRSIDGTTEPLLSTEWDSCVDGDFTATMTGVNDDSYVATVTAKADGTIVVEFEDPDVTVGKCACLTRNSQWESGDGATAWKGYYTVSLPFRAQLEAEAAHANGDGYVTFRMEDDAAVKSGRMVYAGVLANGKAFSGTSVLEAQGGSVALLPVFSLSESDTLTGVFQIDRSNMYREVTAYESAYPYWSHSERLLEASYSGKLLAYGCLYRQEELLKCCTNTFSTQYLTFFALTGKLMDSEKFGTRATYYPDNRPVWSTNNIYAVATVVSNVGGKDSVSLFAPDTARNEHGLTLNFDPATGLVSGQLWLDFYETATTGKRVIATYRGIVKPGWGKIPEGCSSCSDVPTPQESPFISGTCFFPDTYEYEHNSQKRWLQIKRGCPFSIGVEAGK